jgi:flagellar biosynthesis/type III secretory pathway M-ring protein FliF/YscJ
VEELDALKDLVSSAVGLNDARGDVITVRAMPFTLPEFAVEGASFGLLAQLHRPASI